MEVALIVVAAGVVFFVFTSQRGKKAVRAYVYLAARSEGASEAEANDLASRIDTHSAAQLNSAMRQFTLHTYGGRQLAMISGARLDGFRQ